MRKLPLLNGLIFLLLFSVVTFGQQPIRPTDPGAPQKALAEINASLATIQSQITELNLKRATLARERLALIETIAADQTKAAFEGGVIIVVRVSGERSVVLLINGREQEVYLSGLIVKLGYTDDAIALLNRELLRGIAYPRCVDPSCSEVELFVSKDSPSLNCLLVNSGAAMLTTKTQLSCANNPAAATAISEESDKATAPTLDTASSSGSGSSSKHVPGTDVHVRGYYRKDGTYVRPHTRSAPGRRKN